MYTYSAKSYFIKYSFLFLSSIRAKVTCFYIQLSILFSQEYHINLSGQISRKSYITFLQRVRRYILSEKWRETLPYWIICTMIHMISTGVMLKESGKCLVDVPVKSDEGKRRVFGTWFPFCAVLWLYRVADAKPPRPCYDGQWISDASLTHSVRVFHGWLYPDVRHIAVLDRWISMQILCSRGEHASAIFEKRVRYRLAELGERVLLLERERERERERE